MPEEGDRAWVGQNSWAGLTWTQVELIKINPLRSWVKILGTGVGLKEDTTKLISNKHLLREKSLHSGSIFDDDADD
jgi:hypothetical protein